MYEIDCKSGCEGLEHAQFHIKYQIEASRKAKLPNIKILGTGGTIAAKGSSGHQTAGYTVDLTIDDLMKSIPDLSHTCNLTYEQILNVDSKEIGEAELRTIYKQVQKDLPHFDGIVITHGTDTMEETAFFLQFTINTEKPIVLCGSMRPSTAISSDGPMNLYQAIVIASYRQSCSRGILVAFNDRIISGYFLKKANTNSLDTFNSIGQGYMGNFVNNKIYYYFPPAKPLGVSHISITDDFELPEVPIVFAHQGLNSDIIRLMFESLSIKGIVIATMGAGSLSTKTNRILFEMSNKFDCPVIYSKRSMDGLVPVGSLPRFDDINCSNIVAGGSLSPQKSRILLQLCLLNNFDIDKIKRYFKNEYGGS